MPSFYVTVFLINEAFVFFCTVKCVICFVLYFWTQKDGSQNVTVVVLLVVVISSL